MFVYPARHVGFVTFVLSSWHGLKPPSPDVSMAAIVFLFVSWPSENLENYGVYDSM